MDPSRNINAVMANEHPRLPVSDELTTNSGINTYPHLPPLSHGLWPPVPSHGLSPPEELQHMHGYTPSLRHNGYHDHVVSSDARPHHPLTPPRRDDEEQQLQQWHAQQSDQTPHGQRQPPYSTAPSVGYVTPTAHQDYRKHSELLPRVPSEHTAWPSHSYQSSQASNHLNRCLPPDEALAQQWQLHALRTQAASSPYRAPAPGHSDAPLQLQYGHSIMPPVGIFRPPPPQQPAFYLPLPQVSAADQHTPNGTAYGALTHMTPPRQLARDYNGPSPGHDGYTPPEKGALEKQEAYRRKGEERRLKRQATTAARAAQNIPQRTSKAAKRKAPNQAGHIAATVAPPLRRPLGSAYHSIEVHDPFRTNNYTSPYSTHCIGHPQRVSPAHEQAPSVPLGTRSWYSEVKQEPGVQHFPVKSPSPKPDYENLPQRIVSEYADYKWSITLYEIRSDQYDYAQSWLEDFFAVNLTSDKYSWDAHTSRGFIQGGTRLSFIVLHNATDPFGYGSTETTSIGVYGYYWYDHSEIHWKTFSPGIKWLLDWCEDQNGIAVRMKWEVDMPKASDRRFHRAYWLAANRMHLRQLLNHSEAMVDKPHDTPDGDDEEFEVEESDLTNEWGVGVEEAEERWREVVEDVESNGEDGKDGYLHVITGRVVRE